MAMGKFLDEENAKPSLCIKPEVISLDDCLACSGCIQVEEASKFKSDLEFLNDNTTKFSFIISVQSKMNLKYFYPFISYEIFQKNLIKFIKDTFNVSMIVDTSYFKKESFENISSECPAVVLYIERVYPDLLDKLSPLKTFQQLASSFITERIGSEDQKIVSIMQCYDKKDEIKRDKTKIDYFIGSKDFYNFIKDKFKPLENIEYELLPWEQSYDQKIEEISGLENCINIFNKAKSQNVGNLELRICKNGCSKGPALNPIEQDNYFPNLEESSFILKDQFRVFNRPKKRKFDVQW